jgi:HAD superfamily hydrolase (TIGR01549 family)
LIRTVIFDLDDTLFDHQHSRRCGLKVLRKTHSEFNKISLEELEKEHERLLSLDYPNVLDGKQSIVDGTIERIKILCSIYGVTLNDGEARATTELYRSAYATNRQAIPGSDKLLEYLSTHVKVGVITNGLRTVQEEKLKICMVEKYIEFLVISEEVGYRKPDRRIFEEALKRADTKPGEAIYVGDSWDFDIVSASQCGIKTIWLNRYGLECPDLSLATEINSYIGLDYKKYFV